MSGNPDANHSFITYQLSAYWSYTEKTEGILTEIYKNHFKYCLLAEERNFQSS